MKITQTIANYFCSSKMQASQPFHNFRKKSDSFAAKIFLILFGRLKNY
jgi:hypothetical protein